MVVSRISTEEFSPYRFPLISSLDEETKARLLRELENTGRLAYRRREFIVHQGERNAHVHFVQQGAVLLHRTNKHGRAIGIDLSIPGHIFGLEDALCNRPSAFSAQAATACILARLPVDAFRELLLTSTSLSVATNSYIGLRVHSLIESLEILCLENLETRIRKTLQRLAYNIPDQGPPLVLGITQADLAAMVGASRQHVNRVLVALNRLGLVGPGARSIRIIDPSKLDSD